MRIRAEEITKLIRQQILNYEEKLVCEDTGTVLSASDGVARISGLDSCMANEMIEFENGEIGLALNLEKDSVAAVVLGNGEAIGEGMTAYRSKTLLSVPVGEKLLGRVVDALGHPIDGRGAITTEIRRPIENPAPGILQRKSVCRPLETGVKAIDSMIPIGKGQRELIIGDRRSGKTSIAVDAILNQRKRNVVCIYVSIGQKQSSVAELARTLERAGAMEYSIIVSAPASGSAAMEYIAPYSGCAMAEYFLHGGRDVLIVYDDLTKHASAYRALSLLLRRPSGREAYPGDVFYLHSRLLERAAQLSDAEGGGSITALPIIETQSGDVSAYIPTNVISITDGQIFLESELFRSGIRPAINPGISVSRVGGNAQSPIMRKLSGTLRIAYSRYRELRAFAEFGAEQDADTQAALERGKRIVEVFRQGRNSPVPVHKQIFILYALINGYLDSVNDGDIQAYEAGLFAYLDQNEAEFSEKIAQSDELNAGDEAYLRRIMNAYSEAFFAEKDLKEYGK